MVSDASLFLKRSPFIRLLIAFIAGIMIEWYAQCNLNILILAGAAAILVLVCFSSMKIFDRYKFGVINGIAVFAIFACLGGVIAWKKNPVNGSHWFGVFHDPHYVKFITVTDRIDLGFLAAVQKMINEYLVPWDMFE